MSADAACVICMVPLPEDERLPDGSIPAYESPPEPEILDHVPKESPVAPVARLECKHCYHQTCISSWLERASSCPLCRTNFEKVSLCATITGPSIFIYEVKERIQCEVDDEFPAILEDLFDEDIIYGDDDEYQCVICAGDQEERFDQLLICDGCEDCFHLHCLDPPLYEVPREDQWYCQNCIDNANLGTTTRTLVDRISSQNRNRTAMSQRMGRSLISDIREGARSGVTVGPLRANRRRANRRHAIATVDPERRWEMAWQAAWDRLNQDIQQGESEYDPFDDPSGSLSATRRHAQERERWEERLNVSQQRGYTFFRQTAPWLLAPNSDTHSGPHPPARESAENDAWRYLERAERDDAARTPAPASITRRAPNTNRRIADSTFSTPRGTKRSRTPTSSPPAESENSRKARRTRRSARGSVSASPVPTELGPAPATPAPTAVPERRLKRPGTRAFGAGNASHSSASGTGGPLITSNPGHAATARPGGSGGSGSGHRANPLHKSDDGTEDPVKEPTFSSLFKDLEKSTSPRPIGLNNADVALSPGPPSPPIISAVYPMSPRTLSSPRSVSRHTSPPGSRSHSPQNLPRTNAIASTFSPSASPSTANSFHNARSRSHSSGRDVSPRGRRPQLESPPSSRGPSSPENQGAGVSLPLEAKQQVSGIVRSALRPYFPDLITKQQYTEINREVSHKLYNYMADSSADLGNTTNEYASNSGSDESRADSSGGEGSGSYRRGRTRYQRLDETLKGRLLDLATGEVEREVAQLSTQHVGSGDEE